VHHLSNVRLRWSLVSRHALAPLVNGTVLWSVM